MSAEKAVKAIHRALTRREEAAAMRREATDDLQQALREAKKEGVGVTQIASEAGLSRQAVYDLLAEQPSP